jgi:hypothetical protein
VTGRAPGAPGCVMEGDDFGSFSAEGAAGGDDYGDFGAFDDDPVAAPARGDAPASAALGEGRGFCRRARLAATCLARFSLSIHVV